MTTEKVQIIESASGVAIGVFVPIDVWQNIEARLRPAAHSNGTEPRTNGTRTNASSAEAPAPKPRRQRPLTPDQQKIREQYDRIYATEDNRLDPVIAEIQARSLRSEDEW